MCLLVKITKLSEKLGHFLQSRLLLRVFQVRLNELCELCDPSFADLYLIRETYT